MGYQENENQEKRELVGYCRVVMSMDVRSGKRNNKNRKRKRKRSALQCIILAPYASILTNNYMYLYLRQRLAMKSR